MWKPVEETSKETLAQALEDIVKSEDNFDRFQTEGALVDLLGMIKQHAEKSLKFYKNEFKE